MPKYFIPNKPKTRSVDMTLLGWLNISKSGMLSQAVAKHKGEGWEIVGISVWKR